MAIAPYSDPFYVILAEYLPPFSDPFYVDTSDIPSPFISPFSDPFYVDTSAEPREWRAVVGGVLTPMVMSFVRNP